MLITTVALIIVFIIAIALLNEHRISKHKTGNAISDSVHNFDEEEISPTATSRMRARVILDGPSRRRKLSSSPDGNKKTAADDEQILPDPFEDNR